MDSLIELVVYSAIAFVAIVTGTLAVLWLLYVDAKHTLHLGSVGLIIGIALSGMAYMVFQPLVPTLADLTLGQFAVGGALVGLIVGIALGRKLRLRGYELPFPEE